MLFFDDSYPNNYCPLDVADKHRIVTDGLHDFSGINDVFIDGLANNELDESSQKVYPEESEVHSKRADNTIFKTGLGEYRKVWFVSYGVGDNIKIKGRPSAGLVAKRD